MPRRAWQEAFHRERMRAGRSDAGTSGIVEARAALSARKCHQRYMANMSGKNGISTDKTVFLSLLAGETRLCPDKSPMLRRANAHQLPVGRGHCLTKARCSLCRRGHKPNTCDNSGGRQCADRQAYDGFTCRPGGTGKTFNSLCTTMLSATAAVPRRRASASVSSCYTRHRMPSASPLSPPWHKRSTLQYLPGGVLGVHFLDNALKNAVLVEDECSPERPQCGLPVHFLLTPRAEGLEHLRGGVRK